MDGANAPLSPSRGKSDYSLDSYNSKEKFVLFEEISLVDVLDDSPEIRYYVFV